MEEQRPDGWRVVRPLGAAGSLGMTHDHDGPFDAYLEPDEDGHWTATCTRCGATTPRDGDSNA
jgi:hypothetical protein